MTGVITKEGRQKDQCCHVVFLPERPHNTMCVQRLNTLHFPLPSELNTCIIVHAAPPIGKIEKSKSGLQFIKCIDQLQLFLNKSLTLYVFIHILLLFLVCISYNRRCDGGSIAELPLQSVIFWFTTGVSGCEVFVLRSSRV